METHFGERVAARRSKWIRYIKDLDAGFRENFQKIEDALREEIDSEGLVALSDHLRMCGAIPESYGHDTSEEKLYSKYTDLLLSVAFKAIGLQSVVIEERADVADVEVVAENYSFVADAKAFRISRTAKNQKDFKIQAMDNWKHGKPYAVVVAPIYQLPSRNSQIYQQAIARDVCILTFSHICLLTRICSEGFPVETARELLYKVLQTVSILNPSKSAIDYWTSINRIFVSSEHETVSLWADEKRAAIESISFSKREALDFWARKREQIMRMSKDEAIRELIVAKKIESKIQYIQRVGDNGLLELGAE